MASAVGALPCGVIFIGPACVLRAPIFMSEFMHAPCQRNSGKSGGIGCSLILFLPLVVHARTNRCPLLLAAGRRFRSPLVTHDLGEPVCCMLLLLRLLQFQCPVPTPWNGRSIAAYCIKKEKRKRKESNSTTAGQHVKLWTLMKIGLLTGMAWTVV